MRCDLLLHRRTFLRAHAVVEKILAGKTIALFGTGATTRAKKMATFAWIRTEAPALPALRRTVRLREFLTVLRTFAPAALFAAFVACWTDAFRRCKIVHVKISPSLSCDYFLPVDRLDVAEIVVVVHAHTPVENIYDRINRDKLKIVANEMSFVLNFSFNKYNSYIINILIILV